MKSKFFLLLIRRLIEIFLIAKISITFLAGKYITKILLGVKIEQRKFVQILFIVDSRWFGYRRYRCSMQESPNLAYKPLS